MKMIVISPALVGLGQGYACENHAGYPGKIRRGSTDFYERWSSRAKRSEAYIETRAFPKRFRSRYGRKILAAYSTICIFYQAYALGASPPGPGQISSIF